MSGRRALLSVLVGGIAAVALLMAWWSAGDGELAPVTSAAGGAVDASATFAEANRPGDAAARGSGPAGDAVARREYAPDAEPAGGPPPREPDRLLVRVVLASDGSPVVGARVYTHDHDLDWDTLPPQVRDEVMLVDPWQRLLRIGRQQTTDANGYAQVDRPRGMTWALARTDTLLGSCELIGPEPDGGFVIPVTAAGAVTVRVLQHDGQPAARVPLGLAGIRSGRDVARPAPRAVVPVGVTDADGVLVLEHLTEALRDREGGSSAKGRLVVAMPGLTQVGADLDAARLPGDVVELTLPPTGSIDVHLLLGPAQPLLGEHAVWLATVAAEDSGLALENPWRRIRDGSLRWDWVALGRQWRATAWIGGNTIAQEFVGPRRAGEVVPVELSSEAQVTVLRGIAVDAEGRPLARTRLRLSGELARGSWFACQTDADGRFLLALPNREDVATLAGELVRLGSGWRAAGERCVLPPQPLRGGQIDLGELVFGAAPTIATGIVTGLEPLPEVWLWVECWVVPADGAAPGWDHDRSVVAAIEADGRFRVCGDATTGRFRLSTSVDGCEPVPPLEFQAGARDLRIELRRGAGGGVRLRVHSSLLAHPELLVCEVRPPGSADWSQLWLVRQGDTLAAELRGLGAGEAAIRVRAQGHPEALALVEHLEVRPGQQVVDARLQGIDLTTRVAAVRLRAVDAQGQPLGDEFDGTAVPARRDRNPDEAAYFAEGIAWVPAVGAVDVLILTDSHRPHRHQGPAIDADVVCASRFDCVVRFQGLPEPPAGSAWEARFERRGGMPVALVEAGMTPDHDCAQMEFARDVVDGRVEVSLAVPGEFAVTLALVRGDVRSVLGEPWIVPFAAAGEHPIAVPPEAARALVEAARKQR